MRTIAIRTSIVFSFLLLVPAVQAASTLLLNDENCGVIDSMLIDQASTVNSDYSIKIRGATGCSISESSDGTVVLPYSSLDLTVNGGSSNSIEVLSGVAVTLPVSIVLDSWPTSLGNATSNDSTGEITFSANAVSDQITGNRISFHLKGNGGQSKPVDINLTINPGGINNTGQCVEVANLVCKGTSPKLDVGGNIQNIAMAKDAIHVWEFTYHNTSNSGAETILNLDPSVEALSHLEIDFTINQSPGNMNVGVNGQSSCIEKLNVVGVSNYAKTNYCQLVEGQAYYLNMRNLGRKGKDGKITPTNGYYTLVR